MGEKSKKPLIIAILIAALVVCVSIVAIAIVNSGKNSEDSIDDEDNGDGYASFFVDLAEQKETLPDGFESVIADDQNYDYQSTSTDRDNSKK